MRWWKKQSPKGWWLLCRFGRHDDYSSGEPEVFFCARCKRLKTLTYQILSWNLGVPK